jgi:1-deoxy-D-xylulose-5-phosphate synthase
MAYEALNNIGHHQHRCSIVLNDNGRSYAETVGRLSNSVSRTCAWTRATAPGATGSTRPRRSRPVVEKAADASLRGLKQFVSDAPALQSFVEALGVRYLGPVDGHDVERRSSTRSVTPNGSAARCWSTS